MNEPDTELIDHIPPRDGLVSVLCRSSGAPTKAKTATISRYQAPLSYVPVVVGLGTLAC